MQSSLPFEAMSSTFQDSQSSTHERLSKVTTEKISSWLGSSTDHSDSIIWLTGLPNQSSVQEVVELCKTAHQFAAIFSFSSRKGAQQKKEIFPCLAYQIAMNIPSWRSAIGFAMFQDPEVLSKHVTSQFVSLFLAPFDELDWMALGSYRPVIIINGIELHHDPIAQEIIISTIEVAVTSQRLPLRFVFTSQDQLDYTPPFHKGTISTSIIPHHAPINRVSHQSRSPHRRQEGHLDMKTAGFQNSYRRSTVWVEPNRIHVL